MVDRDCRETREVVCNDSKVAVGSTDLVDDDIRLETKFLMSVNFPKKGRRC